MLSRFAAGRAKSGAVGRSGTDSATSTTSACVSGAGGSSFVEDVVSEVEESWPQAMMVAIKAAIMTARSVFRRFIEAIMGCSSVLVRRGHVGCSRG